MTTTARPELRSASPLTTAAAYRRLLAVLPPRYRREHGEELLDVYLEAAGDHGPSWFDRLDVARLAARTWGRALFLPDRRDAERWWAGTVIGVLGLLSFGAGRVVGDAVLAGWDTGIVFGLGSPGDWLDTSVHTFATSPMGWHKDWLVWLLWAIALAIAVGLRRSSWAVVSASLAVVLAVPSWLLTAGSLLGGDRRFLVLDAWGPLVRAGWLALQVVGFLLLVLGARRATVLQHRDLVALRIAALASAAVGIATGPGMERPWLMASSYHHSVAIAQVILALYAASAVVWSVSTRTGRAMVPYAAPLALVFIVPRLLLLRVPLDKMSSPHTPFPRGPYESFLANLGAQFGVPRAWSAAGMTGTLALVALAWFFGTRALRSRRTESTAT